MEAHIEQKNDGVWNDAGFRVGPTSLNLGRDLKLGAVSGFIKTTSISQSVQHDEALIPHIQFDELGTEFTHSPILDKQEDFIVFDGPVVGEVTGKVIGQVFSSAFNRALSSATHITGPIAATFPVTISYYKGIDNTGPLVSRLNIPASAMPANTEFTLLYNDDFGFERAQDIFFEFVSDSIISLAVNASGEVITTQKGHIQDSIDILTSNLMLNENLGIMFNEDLSPMFAIQFP